MTSSLLGTRHGRAIAWSTLRNRWDADVAPWTPV